MGFLLLGFFFLFSLFWFCFLIGIDNEIAILFKVKDSFPVMLLICVNWWRSCNSRSSAGMDFPVECFHSVKAMQSLRRLRAHHINYKQLEKCDLDSMLREQTIRANQDLLVLPSQGMVDGKRQTVLSYFFLGRRKAAFWSQLITYLLF